MQHIITVNKMYGRILIQDHRDTASYYFHKPFKKTASIIDLLVDQTQENARANGQASEGLKRSRQEAVVAIIAIARKILMGT